MQGARTAIPPASVISSDKWHDVRGLVQPEGCAPGLHVQPWDCGWPTGRRNMREIPKGPIMVSMTHNEASVVDEESFSVRRSIQIAAPVEKVWRAVAEPQHISRWFGRG